MNAFRVKRPRQRKKSDLERSPSFRLLSSIDDLGDFVSLRLDEDRVLIYDTIAIVTNPPAADRDRRRGYRSSC